MCDDHPGVSRRTFIHSAAVVGAAAAVGLPRGLTPRLPLRSPARAVTADGTSAYSMAMHIHSSFSEQNGSMDGHLSQATKNAVDVLWWTDHDHRMDAINYRDVTHFTSFSEKGASRAGRRVDLDGGQKRPQHRLVRRRHRLHAVLTKGPGERWCAAPGGAVQQHQPGEVRVLRGLPSGGVELPR